MHTALFAVTLFYALTFSYVKDVVPHFLGASAFILLRVSCAAVLFVFLSFFRGIDKVDWKQHGFRMFLCALTGVMANMLMFFKGLEYTTPVNGSVLMLATPVFVLILNMLIGGSKLIIRQLLGILLACGGSLLLMSGKKTGFSDMSVKGDILIVLNAISYALYLVLVKKLLLHYNTLTVSVYTFIIGVFLVIPFGLTDLLKADLTVMPFDIVYRILFIIICTTFLGYMLNAWAVRRAGPTIVGAYIYLQPVMAGIIAIIYQKDELNMVKILSIILIFAGVYLTTNKNKWDKSKV